MTAATRALIIRADRLHWRGGEDGSPGCPAEAAHVTVTVDTLLVDGWVRLPGCALTVHARRIVARPAGGRMAVIDVSGAAAEPSFDPDAPSSQPPATKTAPHGQPGQDGGPGRPGGRLTIVVDEVDGELGLAANGSAGGDSERGADGTRPAALAGADGAFDKLKDHKGWGRKGRHKGSRTLAPWKRGSADPYVVLAAGLPGKNARRGGDAGPPGQPGDGGDGGRIDVRHSGQAAPRLVTVAAAGAAGRAGADATPGPAGAPGLGGRHRLYAVSVGAWWKWVAHEAYVGEGRDRLLAAMAQRHRIPRRAPAGAQTDQAGQVPPAPTAAAGRDGDVHVAPTAVDGVADDFDLDFLRLALAHALARRDDRARLDWLARVAEAHGGKGAAAIADAARAALQAPATAAEAPRRRRRMNSR